MNSRLSATEQALGDHRLRQDQDPRAAAVLIGGLGMGFTLRAALAVLGPKARVTVAELVPAVVAWARGPMAKLSGDSLTDPRVRIHEGDVGELIRAARAAYDAILLDVDNGPAGMTRKANDGLYDSKGLRAALRRACPAASWRCGRRNPTRNSPRGLRKTGFAVVENPVRAKGPQGGAQHFIWTATRAA